MAEGCPTLDLVDRYNSTPPAGAPAVRTPFIILFDGSAGSSWFAESLDRHPKVFIAGYEPLEWVRRPETYTGMNATGWQAEWLRHVWHLPAGAGRDAFDAWLDGFNANVKLDPRVRARHRALVGAGARARLRGGEGNLQRVLERISLEGQKLPGARA